MTITLDADQASLAQRASVSCLPLVVLETFSDRDARTVDSTYYWTRGTPLVYQWDGATDSLFAPVIKQITPIARGFGHLPDMGDYSTRETARIELDGTDQAGELLWQTLIAENLIGARVTIGSLLVDFSSSIDDPRHFDLSALGDVHVVRWRGEITTIPAFSNSRQTFDLIAESEEVKLNNTRLITGDTVPDEVEGTPLPFVISSGYSITPLPFDVGFDGTLDAKLLTSDTTATINYDSAKTWPQWYEDDHATEYPNTGGHLRIGDDVIYYEQVTVPGAGGAGTADLTGIDEAAFAPNPRSEHLAGASVRIIPFEVRYAISSSRINRVSRVQVSGDNFANLELVGAGSSSRHWQHYVDEDTDPRGPITMLAFWPTAERDSGLHEWLTDPAKAEISVDSEGSYEVGSTASTWIDPTSDAANWDWFGGAQSQDLSYLTHTNPAQGTITQSGADLIIDDTYSAVEFFTRSVRRWWVSVGTPPAGNVQVECTLNFGASDYANLRRVRLLVNSAGFNNEYGAGDAARVWEASELSSGDNVLLLDVNVATVDDFWVETIWSDGSGAVAYTIKGPIRSRPITSAVPDDHPTEIVEIVVNNYLPSAAVTIDATSFATAKTNTPGLLVQPDISRTPTLGSFLAAIGFNSRINFVLSETSSGTVVKAFAAETDYDFPAAAREIGSEFVGLTMALRTLAEIANRFTAAYDLTVGSDGELQENYAGALTADEFTNDISAKVSTATITASQAAFGVRDSITIPFTMISDSATAIDVLGYYANESLRGQVARYSLRVPWWLGYDLEAGDIVSILPPWETTAQKVRVIKTVFNFSENAVGLNVEAVT